uniref:G_PROTEIN_RECEP_F1_2 domain-containing protein n=1 Tax=Strongyloides venezuelensis TaxID=75913 RepID=A0A0K0G5J3_STRVS
MEKNDWTATTFYVIGTQQTTFMFLITLLISINRYIAVKYPLSYKHHFSRSKIIIILLCFIILSTMIGLGNIFLNPRYKKSGFYDYFAPYLESKYKIYYQIFCQLFIYGTISIVTCIFNVMAVLTLKKHKKAGFDLTSVGDFYFLIYLSSELRKALKTNLGCSKKFNNKVNIKVIYRRLALRTVSIYGYIL